MIKAVLNKLLMVLYFVFGALALEFITFRVLNLGTMPQYFMLNLSIIMAIGLFVYIIPNFTAQYVIYTLILLAQTIFLYLNYSLSYIYKDLFSMDMLLLIKEANRAMTANFVYISIILQLVAVFLSIAVFGLILLNFCKKEKLKIKYHYSIFSMIILLSTQFSRVDIMST